MMRTHSEMSEECSDGSQEYYNTDIEESLTDDGNVEIDMDDSSTLQDLRDDYEIDVTIQRVRKFFKYLENLHKKMRYFKCM